MKNYLLILLMFFSWSVTIAQSETERKAMALSILDQHEYLTKEVTRLEYLQLELSDYIQDQAFLVSELYEEIELHKQISRDLEFKNIELDKENQNLAEDVFIYKKRARKRLWIIGGFASGLILYGILK